MHAVRRIPSSLAWIAGLAMIAATAWVVPRRVDVDTLARTAHALARDPAGVALALGCFSAAFLVRSWAWHRTVPPLPTKQAWAGIHLALAANHLLPLRLGEAVRPLAAAKRTGLPLAPLAASTITLRAADILAMAALGLVVAPTAVGALFGVWTWAALVGVAAVGAAGVVWTWRLRRAGGPIALRFPGPAVAVAAVTAWTLEAAVIHQCAAWAGYPISATDAILVTVAAVTAQVAAVAPGGIGTYEAAATAALVLVGTPAGAALAIALVAHAVKTTYSLATGAAALGVAGSPLARPRAPPSIYRRPPT